MIIPIPLPTSTAIPLMYNPAGHSEVIKMNYTIGMGKRGDDAPSKILADTESFKSGISLSSISWSFHNVVDTYDKDGGIFECTLHDIAGKTLEDFITIKEAGTQLFFLGPMSDGSPWIPGYYAVYEPVHKECSLEFSPTQGFTYKIVGKSSAKAVSSPQAMIVPEAIIIDGLLPEKTDKPHDNTFRSYLKEFEQKWNDKIAKHPGKTGTAQLKFEINEGEGVNSMMMNATPYYTEKNQKPIEQSGDAATRVMQYEIPAGATVTEAVTGLWQQRFVGKDTDPDKGTSGSSTISVVYKKYEGGINYVALHLFRKKDMDSITAPIPVCIGSDLNCIGALYRASLSNIDLNSFINNVVADKVNQELAQSHGEASQVGNTENKTSAVSKGDKSDTSRGSASSVDNSPGLPKGNNTQFDGWSTFDHLLNRVKQPLLTIEIDMPYTFAFTPKMFGGLLKDSDPDKQLCTLAMTCGIELEYYWYTDPTCEVLVKVSTLSTKWRINSITHTIGLNGNSTQVKLSHLSLDTH